VNYCQENNIQFTASMPISLFSHRLGQNGIVQSIAQAHSASPSQIALAWLVNQPLVVTIPMSFNPQHQKENIAAAVIELTQEEMAALNQLA
jgi:diketogulonate reductase-like aldo/keto reductase